MNVSVPAGSDDDVSHNLQGLWNVNDFNNRICLQISHCRAASEFCLNNVRLLIPNKPSMSRKVEGVMNAMSTLLCCKKLSHFYMFAHGLFIMSFFPLYSTSFMVMQAEKVRFFCDIDIKGLAQKSLA